MLTAEQNDLLCRVNGDAPMGALMKRYWLPVCLASEVSPRAARPFALPSSTRTSSFSAARMARSGPSTNIARIAACRWRATKTLGSGASITAGNSPLTARSSRCRPSRRPAGPESTCVIRPIPSSNRAASSGVPRAQGSHAQISGDAVGIVPVAASHHHQGRGRRELGTGARRPDRLGAQLDAAFDRDPGA